jgi:hypothetical protein
MKALPARHPRDPSNSSAPVLRECAICQTAIDPEEQTTPCPSCGLIYHVECWQHNLGCASYGCDQVNALAPKPQSTIEAPQTSGGAEATGAAPAERVPWSFVLLGAAALGAAGSVLFFGVPSAVVALAVGWRAAKTRDFRDRILLTAAGLCVVGVVAGLTLSRFWWTNE